MAKSRSLSTGFRQQASSLLVRRVRSEGDQSVDDLVSFILAQPISFDYENKAVANFVAGWHQRYFARQNEFAMS